jgi:AcrR family transcriptional regulator
MEARIPDGVATGGTRSDFLKAARRLFAERGFYGASIAAIADELGLTKQALIHHFGTKERLYGEVLAQMAERLAREVKSARSADPDPEQQLETLFARIYENSEKHPEDTQLLMRELLDNRPRAEAAQSWYLRDFLDAIVAMVRAGRPDIGETQALARVYLLMGSVNYFVVSDLTLKRMFGEAASKALKAQFPQELRRLVRTSFG